jgi:hypothetical protein
MKKFANQFYDYVVYGRPQMVDLTLINERNMTWH